MSTATQPQSTGARPSVDIAPEAPASNRGRIVLGLVILAAIVVFGWVSKQWLYGRSH